MSDTKTNPATESELNDAIMKAVEVNDHLELDRLMAVQLPESSGEVQEELHEEEKPVEEDGTSEVEEATKEEAAPEVKESAASTPEVVKVEENETEALKRELHKLKSDAGRVPHMQSRLKELERELREVKLSHSVGSVDPADPSKVEVPTNIKKKIEDLREVDPALADLLEDMTKALRSETHETAGRLVSTITESEREYDEQRTISEQYNQLVSEVAWAPQAFKSQEWKDWKDTLTPGKRAMAESMYADDVKIALGEFAGYMRARQGSATSAQQAPARPVVDEEAERIKQERARKLATGSTTKAPTAKASAPPLDEEALFREAYERIQKENHLK